MSLIIQILAVAKAALELVKVMIETLSETQRLRRELKDRKH